MQRKRSGQGILLGAVVAVAVAHLCGCRDPQPQTAPARKPVPVHVGQAVRKPVAHRLQATGHVEAEATVAVRTRVGGELLRVHFREGEELQAGDLLFSLDPRPFEASLRQAEAVLARDEALLENARAEALRYEQLFHDRLVSQREYDQFRTGRTSLEATVQADRAAVDQARLQLSYAEIRSPLAGRAGALQVDRGNLIRANDDQPLVVVHQLRPIAVIFAVPEGRLGEIRRQWVAGALKVEALLPGGEGEGEKGELVFIDPAVDRGTGTVRLKGIFANGENRLWPGQFVQVVLTLARDPEALLVPSRAVQAGVDGLYVYVVEAAGTVSMRPVAAGTADGEETVILSGLAGGETVVTDGHLRLTPGARVEIAAGGGRP